VEKKAARAGRAAAAKKKKKAKKVAEKNAKGHSQSTASPGE